MHLFFVEAFLNWIVRPRPTDPFYWSWTGMVKPGPNHFSHETPNRSLKQIRPVIWQIRTGNSTAREKEKEKEKEKECGCVMVTRWSEKGPGLKILWVWTFGTAAILIGSVVRTRLNDMEKILREEDQAAAAAAAATHSQSQSQSQSQSHHVETILKDD
ncbi:hypothetical protein FCM35_KLT18906 [Carex littledalei]|uniref:Transmembrane protein n=1 Tax=Carex littledalei TaxID=544730 RepID=A0A833QW05_9POAL|nr:hypothetical protein FCM35_KLT18906 [Carex littledalei]